MLVARFFLGMFSLDQYSITLSQSTNKIYRGGSFAGVSGTLEGKDRFQSSPATQSAAIGFRCGSSDLIKY